MNFYEKAHKRLSKLLTRLFRVKVVGSENEPEQGGYLVCANHISYLDVIVLAVATKRQINFMAKKELFKVPLLGKLITALGAFPVDRTGNSVGSLKKTIAILEEGRVVGMFPQGHRYPGKPLDELWDSVKGGSAMVVRHAKVPVLPVYIETKKARFRLFRPITVHLGKPIAYESFGFDKGGAAEYERGARLIYGSIVALAQSSEAKDSRNG